MKILHFHPDGRMAAKFVEPLMEAERSAEHESSLVVDRNPGGGSQRVPYDISVPVFLMLPLSLFKLMRVIRSVRPDVVVSHNSKSSVLPLLAAKLLGVQSRLYFNHGVPYTGYGGIVRRVLKQLEIWNCRLATHVLTVSSDMVGLLRDVVPDLQAAIIANGSACGVDLRVCSADKYSDRSWRRHMGYANDDLVVAFVGRPKRRKGIVHTLDLWRDYLTDPKYRLLLCGAGRSDIMKFVEEIPPNVECLGFVDNIHEILSNVDILILPSLHEGLSYVILEAMACGAVVIVNDIPGTRCLVENGVNGYLVRNNSLERYAELTRAVSRGEAGGEEMLSKARETAAKFDRDHFLTEYLAFMTK